MWDKITRFAGDRIKDVENIKHAVTNEMKWGAKQLRDNVVVPTIDKSMESGIIPADAGMFGRYLTGTEVPLTVAPADLKRDEAEKAQRLSGANIYEERKQTFESAKEQLNKFNALKRENIIADEQKIKDLISQQSSSGINIRDHRMGVGPAQDPTQVQEYINRESQIETLQNKWPNTLYLGEGNSLSTDASQYSVQNNIQSLKNTLDENSNYEIFKGQTPDNYTSDIYTSEDWAQADATTNSLGRYTVEDGVITDRYDFNEYKKRGVFNPGGVVGGGSMKRDGALNKATYWAGGVADRLGLIKPGSGYDVRIKVR